MVKKDSELANISIRNAYRHNIPADQVSTSKFIYFYRQLK